MALLSPCCVVVPDGAEVDFEEGWQALIEISKITAEKTEMLNLLKVTVLFEEIPAMSFFDYIRFRKILKSCPQPPAGDKKV